MRQTRVPHLYNRNGIYYFRYRLSKRTAALLNKWEIRRSLGKVSFQQASIINSFLQLSAKILEQRAARMPEGKKLTSEEAEKFIQEYFKKLYKNDIGGLESSSFDPLQEIEFQISSWQDHYDIMNNFWKWDNQSGDGSVSTIVPESIIPDTIHNSAKQFAKSQNIQPVDYSHKPWIKVARGLAQAEVEIARIAIAQLRGQHDETGIKDPKFRYNTQLPPDMAETETIPRPLNQLIQTFIETHTKIWAMKTTNDYKRVLGWLAKVYPEKQINKISKDDVRDFRDILNGIPKYLYRLKKYKNKPLTIFIKSTVPNNERLQPTTAKKYWGLIQHFFIWLSDEGYIAESPASSLTIKDNSNPQDKKDAFSEEQLEKLFTSPIFTGCKSLGRRTEPGDKIIKDYDYWLPLIGMYTGMRMSEIIQIHINDIAKTSDGIWLFDLQNDGDDKKFKSNSSVRKIPLHKDLMKLGFLEFIEERRAKEWTRLFEDVSKGSDGTYSKTYSKRFANRLNALNIKTKKTSFHSFRHN